MITYGMVIIALSAALLVGTADAETEPTEITIYISDTLAEPLPAGYQTTVVGGDTLMVQVLAEPRLANESSLAASDDSLSAQTKAMETSPQAAVGNHAITTEEPDRHLLNSVFIGDPFRSASTGSLTLAVESKTVKERKEEDDIRGKKLAAGVKGGLVGALTGGIIAVFGLGMIPPPEAEPGTDPSLSNAIRGLNTLIHGMWGGNIVGTAVGVSRVDPQDNFLITLAGSAIVGAGVPYAIALTEWAESEGGENLLILSGLLGPIVGATIASERWSKPLSAKLHLKPEVRQVSIGLLPNPKGGLSAVATLRF